MRILMSLALTLTLCNCGVGYFSPSVSRMAADGMTVRVVPMTPQSVLDANNLSYVPKSLPAAFSQNAGAGGSVRGLGAQPDPSVLAQTRPAAIEQRLPNPIDPSPYRIGVGDVVILATPSGGGTVEQLSGLLAAQNSRQGYTVQDDGAIAIPNVGRVSIGGMTLEEAEAELFQRLVENQIDPTFSLEIADFNSKKVSIGGAVGQPGIVPITLTPLYLDQAIAAAGGIRPGYSDYAVIRLFRGGQLYQIPARDLAFDTALQRIQLVAGDSLFVDSEYDLEKAQAYFTEQIELLRLRREARSAALEELAAEVALRRAALEETRSNFERRAELGGLARDYVYLTGEVSKQGRYSLPFGLRPNLADALFDAAGGIPTETGNVREIYVLRGAEAPDTVTAFHLDGRNAANLLLATKFELRPNDVVFVAEQPVTRWGRVVRQITPSLITTGVSSASN